MKRLLLIITALVTLSGCNTIPKDAFKLNSSSLEQRQMQSRAFETRDELALMSAGISTLQDMGYKIDETEKELGIVTGSKNADATDTGQIVGAVVVALLTGAVSSIDDHQKITASFVTYPSSKSTDVTNARVRFQQIIWNTQGQVTKAVTIEDNDIYVEFFDKLSKSVFLEANEI